MATRITPVRVSQTGVSQVAGTAADTTEGNVVSNTEGLQLTVDNTTGASPVTVTFLTTATVEGYAVADITATVTNGASKRFGRFSRDLFGSDVEFTVSGACTVSAYR